MNKIQVIKCKCGSTFSGCCEPECYTDKDYLKELKRYIEKGCTVDMVDKGKFDYQPCRCNTPKEKEPENPSQLKIDL